MIDYHPFLARLALSPARHWLRNLPADLHQWQQNNLHGDFVDWIKVLKLLPDVQSSVCDIKNKVQFGQASDIDNGQKARLDALLKKFKPWRKGPFELFGTHIDTEWRSDWKWQRVLPHLDDLNGRQVLDIGCGSGYHLWRMKGAGADLVVGIDPSQLFVVQFKALQKYAPPDIASDVELLPIGVEQLPELGCFDTVFSMGVLYHRRSPIDFLHQCRAQLRSGGQLVLETLIIDGDEQQVLMPEGRYAQMRNVWYLPSIDALSLWMRRCGFVDIQVVDVNTTTSDEQRTTEWMENKSLQDFLDPNDSNMTIEGYQAPKRAVLTARRP